MAMLLEDTPRRVLAVYAHPDDADVSCGGSLALWAKLGAEVRLLVCTNGDKGSADASVDPETLTGRRIRECADAAASLGLDPPARLGYADGELEDGVELRGRLVEWIRRLRPDTVLCPDPTAIFFGGDYFNHRDHRVLGFATLDAVAPAASLPHYFPGAGAPHQVGTVLMSGTLEPDVWVDVTTTIDAKVAAVSCHRSQFPEGPGWAGDAVRRRATEDGRQCGVECAEGFRRLRLGG